MISGRSPCPRWRKLDRQSGMESSFGRVGGVVSPGSGKAGGFFWGERARSSLVGKRSRRAGCWEWENAFRGGSAVRVRLVGRGGLYRISPDPGARGGSGGPTAD